MTVGTLDRRTAALLGVGVAAVLLLRFGIYGRGDAPAVVGGADSVEAAENRLERLRKIAQVIPAREAELQRAQELLASREKRLLAAATAAQAQAQLQETVRGIGQKEGIEVRGAEELKIKALGDDYGEVSVTVAFTCTIEQFVNLLAALANEPQLLATSEIRISAANAKQKTIQVRLSVSGAVPKKLVPEKKGLAAF